ncbi:MAG: helix-turn-helix domain-containing protein [Leptospirales bacterium]|nr:helix-turn-helix domain-containing protein [Leptospirales bacterium]
MKRLIGKHVVPPLDEYILLDIHKKSLIKTFMKIEELISPREAAQLIGVATKTVSRYRREGRLPFVQYSARKVLYRKTDVICFIESSYKEKKLQLF